MVRQGPGNRFEEQDRQGEKTFMFIRITLLSRVAALAVVAGVAVLVLLLLWLSRVLGLQ